MTNLTKYTLELTMRELDVIFDALIEYSYANRNFFTTQNMDMICRFRDRIGDKIEENT